MDDEAYSMEIEPATSIRTDSSLELLAHIESSSCCHVGLVRGENQDRIGHAVGALGEIFVVADGVGGDAGGAEAASLAVAVYEGLMAAAPALAIPDESPAAALQRATEVVHNRIQTIRQTQPEFGAMASTVAAVLVQGQTATVGHLGDSRVYLARGGEVRLITRDHTVVQRMIDGGILTEDEARTHPSGHILTSSLGQVGAELDVATLALEQDDVLLLCSDGLWGYVSEAQLARELRRAAADPSITADALLLLALAAGAPDNVSIVLLRVSLREREQEIFSETGWKSETTRDVRTQRGTDVAKGGNHGARRTLQIVSAAFLVGVAVALLFLFAR